MSLSRLSGGDQQYVIGADVSMSLSRLSGGDLLALLCPPSLCSLSRLSGGDPLSFFIKYKYINTLGGIFYLHHIFNLRVQASVFNGYL